MKKFLYYHIYVRWDLDSTLDIILEQMKAMEDSNLLDQFDAYNFVLINRSDNSAHQKYLETLLKSFVADNKSKINFHYHENPFYTDEEMIRNIASPKMITENVTYRKLFNFASSVPEESLICYIHTKGITRTIQHYSLDMESIKRYYYWRQYLNWGVISNWRKCVEKIEIEKFDVSGINFTVNPSPHYSGNFWWATTDHIKKLPNPATIGWWHDLQQKSTDHWLRNVADDRYRDEQWLCSLPETKAYNVADLPDFKNPAFRLLPRSEYGEIN